MPPPKDPIKKAEWLRRQSDSHKGKPTWMKGRKHKPESIEKNKLKHLGNDYRKNKLASQETKDRISKAVSGRNQSEETKRKIGIAGLGNQRAKGSKHTDEWKKWKSESQIGEKNPFFNKKHKDESKLAISKANTGNVPWIKGKNHSETTRAKLKITRMHQVFPRKDSKPERILQIALALRNITFEKHKPIFGQPDIFLEPNICIFVDGDYWHRRPEVIARDNEVNETLAKKGYNVKRIWEKDVRKDANKAIESILKLA